MVLDMAKEVIPIVKRTPVIAGVCASDPFRDMRRFLLKLRDEGFVGVQVSLLSISFAADS